MVGTTVSHYRILEKIGEGGLGAVYKGHDTRLDRVVALKFLFSRQSGSDGDHDKLLREARAMAAVRHPNICSIIDVEEYEDKEFLVLEFIEGKNLRSVIEAAPVDPREAIRISLQIAEGLRAAHMQGITHRDIKPENILIASDGVIKIADFG